MKKCFHFIGSFRWNLRTFMLSFCPFILAIGTPIWDGIKIQHSKEEWLQILGPEKFRVMREKATERAFVGKYVRITDKAGIYHCGACYLPLFDSADQYDAGGGYPCFKQAKFSKHIYFEKDNNLPIQRYEILCRACDSHLGHIFNDGPPPKHLRYCINSIALVFVKSE